MKMKVALLLCLMIGASSLSFAQKAKSEEWKKMHTERIKEHAAKKAETMKLEGNKKEEFTTLFTAYQNELMDCHRKTGQRYHKNKNKKQVQKPLTEAEANARVDRFFQAKEAQLETMKLRLEVQKKYRNKFARILTPQQMTKIFREPMGPATHHHKQGHKGMRAHH